LGFDVAGAHGSLQVVRALLRPARRARDPAARGGEAQLGGVPSAGPRPGPARPALRENRGAADPRAPRLRRREPRRHHVRAAPGGALGPPQPAATVSALRARRAHAVGQGGVLLADTGGARPPGPTDLRATRRGPGPPRARPALPAPVHRAAQPLLPELVLQSVRAPARPAEATDRLRLPDRRGRAGDRGRGPGPRLQ